MSKQEPAFPSQPLGSDELPECEARTGVTLRDYFAAHAMQGLLAGGYDVIDDPVARHAYEVADDMMNFRD